MRGSIRGTRAWPRRAAGSDSAGVDHPDSLRRFFLADPDAPSPRLLPEEQRHAVGVLRLAAGDRLLGLDGIGGLHPLIVRAAGRGGLELERDGELQREPAPGEPGAALPWIEVSAAIPRAARAEEMLDRLTQLGVAAFRPLVCERTQGFARELSEGRMQRLQRACMQACKQARRSWMPRILPVARPGELSKLLAGKSAALLSPRAEHTLLEWGSTRLRGPWALIAGPEGGFEPNELAELDFAEPVALGPHVLRIETAVEAASAALVQLGYARSGRA